MSDLTAFRAHAQRMSEPGAHKPPCPGWVETEDITRWGTRRREHCPGCVPAEDREWWVRLAAEVDAYLAPQVDLFGDETFEPVSEETA